MFPQSYWNGMFTSPKNLRSPGPSVFWLPHQAFKDALSSGDSSCSHEGKPGSDPWHQRCSVENEQQIHWDKIMGKLCEMCFQLGVLPFQISDKPFHQNILIQIEYLSWPPHLAILLGFKHCSGFSMFQHQIRVKAGTQVIMYIKYIIYIYYNICYLYDIIIIYIVKYHVFVFRLSTSGILRRAVAQSRIPSVPSVSSAPLRRGDFPLPRSIDPPSLRPWWSQFRWIRPSSTMFPMLGTKYHSNPSQPMIIVIYCHQNSSISSQPHSWFMYEDNDVLRVHQKK